ncbi:plasmid replication protein RepC [Rhizobium ruizarguesonis]
MKAGDVTTPFGRRGITLAQAKDQMNMGLKPLRTINKWQVLRDICDARTRLKLRDRALAVLNALLSFHPETNLAADDNLIVFPSNAQLSSRANGIADTTLRENLAVLVQAGIIHRRDSPNGKRYARKNSAGRIETAFGFSLAPLIARAAEFAGLAQAVASERRQQAILRERITLLRRDIRKLISAAIEEGAEGNWHALEADYIAQVSRISRVHAIADLVLVEAALTELKSTVLNTLESQWKEEKNGANADDIGCHIQNQNTYSCNESELLQNTEAGEKPGRLPDNLSAIEEVVHEKPREGTRQPYKPLPLGMIVRFCPEITFYGPHGRIDSWRDLMAAAIVVRSTLGVSPSAYQEACEVIGAENAAATMACILERAGHIRSPGGYLRELTHKARRGEFSVASMLMALQRR